MHISIKAEPIFHTGSFVVTNTLLTSWLVVALLIIFAFIFSKKIKSIPGRLQALVEFVIEKFMDFMESFAGSRETMRKFLPLVLTIFIFVLALNWSGVLPGVETIGFREVENGEEIFVPLFRTANSDVNLTLMLALVVVIGSHIVGLRSIGAKHHAQKFLVNPLKHPIGFFVGILEIVGEFSRIISLTFRLFGNIFAGSVLMLIISFLAPYIIPIPFLGLELFVGFIQALVFAVLAMMFMASATRLHESH
ncbi:MAG TPA: F0F1 ATP synthase subunit A [Candidatus Paceibacterota bacterium]